MYTFDDDMNLYWVKCKSCFIIMHLAQRKCELKKIGFLI